MSDNFEINRIVNDVKKTLISKFVEDLKDLWVGTIEFYPNNDIRELAKKWEDKIK